MSNSVHGRVSQDSLDRACEYYDSHPNLTIREVARMFNLPEQSLKMALLDIEGAANEEAGLY
jgi:hypothetical protein